MNTVIVAAEQVNDFDWTVANTRNLLHLLTVIVWVGGQVVVGAMMPVARRLGPEAPLKIARRFGRIGWPAFFLAVITGLWNMGSSWEDASNNWKVVLIVKIGIVVLTGITAWRHQKAETSSQRALFAMATLGLSIAVIVLGIGLGN